jgi:hypothetical protein
MFCTFIPFSQVENKKYFLYSSSNNRKLKVVLSHDYRVEVVIQRDVLIRGLTFLDRNTLTKNKKAIILVKNGAARTILKGV